MCATVEEWLDQLHEDGLPLPEARAADAFSGRFVLCVEPALHRRLAAKALAAGESLNTFCVRTLRKF